MQRYPVAIALSNPRSYLCLGSPGKTAFHAQTCGSVLFSLFLDFIWINAVVRVWLHPSECHRRSGNCVWRTFAVVGANRHLPGLALDQSAAAEPLARRALCSPTLSPQREAGVRLRRWPNPSSLGRSEVLSGVNELVRGTEPGTGVPFLFMVEENTAQDGRDTRSHGALFGFWEASCPPRFATGAKAAQWRLAGERRLRHGGQHTIIIMTQWVRCDHRAQRKRGQV